MTLWKVVFVSDKEPLEKAQEVIVEAEYTIWRGRNATFFDDEDDEVHLAYNVKEIIRVIE